MKRNKETLIDRMRGMATLKQKSMAFDLLVVAGHVGEIHALKALRIASGALNITEEKVAREKLSPEGTW